MSRGRALVTIAVLIVAVCCAPPPKVVSNISSPSASPTPVESPTPSPSPTPIPPLTIASASFHTGELSLGYAPAAASAKGGVPPYAWAIGGGSLPPGLSFGADGTLAGQPTAVGTFLFTVQVADSVGATASVSTTMGVVKHVVVTATCPVAQPCQVEAGCVTACGGFGNQSGGAGPFTYRVIAGTIPTGMGFSGFSLTKAFPSPAADWTFTVRVTDALGATAQAAAKFHVFPHIAFEATTASCDGVIATGCSAQLKYTLGTPGLALPTLNATLAPGPDPLPTGSSFTARSGIANVSIPAPGCGNQRDFHWTVTLVLVDRSFCSAGIYCASAPATVKINLINNC